MHKSPLAQSIREPGKENGEKTIKPRYMIQ